MMQEETLINLACMGIGCNGVVYDIQGGYGIINSLKSLGITTGKREESQQGYTEVLLEM
jgi:hypothetical protein